MILYQRAYLKHFYNINPLSGSQVAAFGGERNSEQSIRSILGGSATTTDDFSASTMRSQLLAGRVLGVGGTGHRYAVTDVFQDANGNWKVTLYNPWGEDKVHKDSIDFDADGSNDGFITLRWSEFNDHDHFENYTYSG